MFQFLQNHLQANVNHMEVHTVCTYIMGSHSVYIIWAWKDIGDSLKQTHYLSRVDHVRKISTRRQRTDIGKYSFVNRTIGDWNQLPAEVLETLPCKPSTFRKRLRKVITECIKGHPSELNPSVSVVK